MAAAARGRPSGDEVDSDSRELFVHYARPFAGLDFDSFTEMIADLFAACGWDGNPGAVQIVAEHVAKEGVTAAVGVGAPATDYIDLPVLHRVLKEPAWSDVLAQLDPGVENHLKLVPSPRSVLPKLRNIWRWGRGCGGGEPPKAPGPAAAAAAPGPKHPPPETHNTFAIYLIPTDVPKRVAELYSIINECNQKWGGAHVTLTSFARSAKTPKDPRHQQHGGRLTTALRAAAHEVRVLNPKRSSWHPSEHQVWSRQKGAVYIGIDSRTLAKVQKILAERRLVNVRSADSLHLTVGLEGADRKLAALGIKLPPPDGIPVPVPKMVSTFLTQSTWSLAIIKLAAPDFNTVEIRETEVLKWDRPPAEPAAPPPDAAAAAAPADPLGNIFIDLSEWMKNHPAAKRNPSWDKKREKDAQRVPSWGHEAAIPPDDEFSLESAVWTRQLWTSHDKRGVSEDKLYEVSRDSPEFFAVSEGFGQTLEPSRIERLQRVENGFQYRAHRVYVEGLQSQMGKSWDANSMHRLLFHGTHPDVIRKVTVPNEAGFLPLINAKHAYGKGTYFAVRADLSDRYSKADKSGLKYMFVVMVAVGASVQGKSSSEDLPEIPGKEPLRYNSYVNKLDSPSIYVCQQSAAMLPAYVITYK